jgi:membrane protein required for colicin V production
MNYIDIIILVLLVVFGIAGLRKGLIIELATLLGLGVGLYGAFHFSDFTAEKLVNFVEINPKYLNVIAFIVTFIVLAILVNLLGRLVAKLVKTINLGFIDKIGGFVVGVAKGVLICSLLVMLLNALELKGVVKDKAKQNSLLYPYVEQAVPYVYQGFDLVKEAVQENGILDDSKSPDECDDVQDADSEQNVIVI